MPVRYAEIIMMEEPQSYAAKQQKAARDNERLTKARQATTDAFRTCQKDQQKARDKRDPEAMADATRRFNSARAKANASMSAATAKLSKDR